MRTMIAAACAYLFACSSSHINYSCLSRGIDGEYFGTTNSWKENKDRVYRARVFKNRQNYFVQIDIGENEPNKEFKRDWVSFVDTLQSINNKNYQCNNLLKGKVSEVYIYRDEVYCEILDRDSMKKMKLKLIKK
jgi:hypothetical protein